MDTDLLHREFADAVKTAGGFAPYARLVGKSKQAVSQSIGRGSIMPPDHVLKVEAALGISRSRLRPDLYPEEDAPP